MNTPANRISLIRGASETQARSLRILLATPRDTDAQHLIDAMPAGILQVIRQVSDPAALLRALEEVRWDAILLDTRHPETHPLLALKTIRHYAPEVPLLAILERRGGSAGKVWAANGVASVVEWDRLDGLIPFLNEALRYRHMRGSDDDRPGSESLSAPAGEQSQTDFLQLADNIPECFWLVDVAEQRIVYANAAYRGLFGDQGDDPMGWFRLVHPDDAARLAEAVERTRFGGLNEELRVMLPAGNECWLQVRTFAVRDDAGIVGRVGGMARDITESVSQQIELYNLSRFDRVTELPNRLLFQERLAAALALARRNDWRLAVLFIDLDRFKLVNDTLGYRIGDQLLHIMATRVRACLRDSDTVGRLGGDEFAVILPDLENAELAAVVARKIIETVGQACVIENEELFVSASVGITMYPDDGDDSDVLVRNADAAMYLAKEAGRSTYAFYTPEMNARARARMAMENDLRRALAKGEFMLYYQPKVCCQSGRVLGLEALLRWRHPERGMVGPNEFVSLLEETGLIIPVGEWVLRTACAQTMAWRNHGFPELTVAVNLSARQIESWDVLGGVEGALRETGLPASALELELTETMLMEDEDAVVAILAALKRKGVRVAVDDFGTGYSSLSYLKRFPIDSLKVDRSFVQDITADSGDASITRAVIRMGHELALKVVAEGVETEGQMKLLVAAGCDQIQGYYISRPLPPEQLEYFLATHPDIVFPAIPHEESDAGGAEERYQELLRELVAARETLASVQQERDQLRGQCTAGWRLWSATMDGATDPVISLARDGLILYANPAAERVFGALGWLPGCVGEEVFPPELVTALQADAREEQMLTFGAQTYRVSITALDHDAGQGSTLLRFSVCETC